MSDVDPRDDEVGRWLRGEAPPSAPDRLREAVRADIAQAAQEPASVVPLRRLARPLLAVAAAAAVIVVAVGLARPGTLPSIGGVIGTPSAATPSPSPAGSPVPTPFGQPLPAGPLRSSTFSPPIAIDVPDGWIFNADVALLLRVLPADAASVRQPDGEVFFDAITAYADPVAGAPDGSVGGIAGVGRGAEELATWLASRPQLVTTGPTPITFAGRPAWQVDFRLSPEAGGLCGVACISLFDSPDQARSYQVGYLGDAQVRAILVQVTDARTVLVAVEDVDGSGLDALVARAQPILDSWTFLP